MVAVELMSAAAFAKANNGGSTARIANRKS